MRLNDKGNVAIVAALCLPMIVGGAAFGIEVGYWRYDQVRVQQAADAAAYAGAVVKREQGSAATSAIVTTAATSAATTDGYTTTTDTITVNIPSTATPNDANSVEAVISRTEPPIFTAYIRCLVSDWQNSSCASSEATVKASATASFSFSGDACILALSPSAQKAVDVAGNSSLNLNGCVVMSDSLASNAVNVQGSANLTAPCVYSSGGAISGGTVTLTTCPTIKTAQPPVADPFSGLTIPTQSGKCKNQPKNQSPSPDTLYCGLDFKDTETLASGTYYIDSGGMSLEANSNITCTSCTFVFSDGGGLTMNGNAHINFSAPTSGPLQGFLFVADRSDTASFQINGDSTSSATGAIYVPDGSVSYLGNFSGTNGCTQIVAQTVSWSGNTTFGDNCAAAGLGEIKVGSVVRLSA